MADTARLVEYFYVLAPNRPGEGARRLTALKDARVDLLAFSGFPNGRQAQLDFVPVDPHAFRLVARRARWKVVGPKRGFLLQGDNRVGVVADMLSKLAHAKVNVIAVDAVGADGRYCALVWVAPRDIRRAAKALGAT
jgi:hypothetical protein